jgi:lysophospholipase L1-like esterase
MNHNRKVVVFTISTTLILFFYSVFAAFYPSRLPKFENVNIITDVLNKTVVPQTDSAIPVQSLATNLPLETVNNGPQQARDLRMYRLSRSITAFYTDTNIQALPALMNKLYAIRRGKRDKVRIAWLGDSLIEGDLLTQTFRKKIQPLFGGYGVGFVPVTSVVAPFRTSVSHKWTGEWKEENFKTKELTGNLFLSGHMFHTGNGTITVKDQSFKDSTQRLEKSLICGQYAGSVDIAVNGIAKAYQPNKKLNRLLLDSSTSHSIEIGIQNDRLPVYGLSFEPQTGLVVDNFSFRGITGLELSKLDTAFLQDLQEENHYDLVILEYGANLLFRPDDSDYSWFQSHIKPVIKRLKDAMPNTEFLIVSSSDRAFKYGETWRSAKGINNLIKSQAELAYGNGSAFYNLFASMGGTGTIVSWAESTPALANKDYIHPNQRGAEILGNIFFESFMKDFAKNQSSVVETGAHAYHNKKSGQQKDNLNTNISASKQILDICRNGNPSPPKIGKTVRSTQYSGKADVTIKTAYRVNMNEGKKAASLKNKQEYPIVAFVAGKYVGNTN